MSISHLLQNPLAASLPKTGGNALYKIVVNMHVMILEIHC
jgi:hypothetical protein